MCIWHTCQVSGFGGESPDFAPHLPLLPSPPGERRNLRIFDSVSGFLRIYVLFHLKLTKLFVFTAVVAWQSLVTGYNPNDLDIWTDWCR